MRTDQIMTIDIKGFGNIVIGHKTKLAKVSDVLAIGNNYRVTIGEKPVTSLQSYFRKPSTWRTIIAIHNKIVEKSNSSQSYLDIETTMKSLPKVKGANHQIDYNAILKSKQFNHIIKSQKGGKVENRGYYVNLWLMIDIAMMMNEEFKVELIDIFIENKILDLRDSGGNGFKKLNVALGNLPDFSFIRDTQYYKEIARLIRHKVFDLPSYENYENIWNEEIATPDKLALRDDLVDKYTMLIEEGYITSFHALWLKLGGKDPKVSQYILEYSSKKEVLNKLCSK